MPEVRVQSVSMPERVIQLEQARVTIGRASDSDISLPDQRLSRWHAVIQQRDQGFFIVDLGSTNGTYLNGDRVRRDQLLRDGDVVTVGESTLVFHEDAHPRDGTGELRGVKSYPIANLATRNTQPTLEISEAGDQNRMLGILCEATTELVQYHPIPELYHRILDTVLDAIPAERGAILLVEGRPPRPLVKSSRSRDGSPPITQVSSSLIRRVTRNQETLLLQDVLADATLKSRESVVSAGTRSVLCAPLWLRDNPDDPGKAIGVIYLDSRQRVSSFSESMLQILTVIANVAAAKIENARLFEEKIEKNKLEADLQLAAEIQGELLPRTSPVLDGYELAGATQSCRAVGGDYYDWTLAGPSLLFSLGDVSGKGIGAAMLMTALRASLRAHWLDAAPAEVIARVNRTFLQCVPDEKFATLFLGRLDTSSGRLYYVNAGHNRPLLVRAGGGFDRLEEGGIIIGAFDGTRHTEGRIDLRPGDVLLGFSDGISETWEDPEMADRTLTEIVRRYERLDAAGIRDGVFREVGRMGQTFVGKDDQTVIVLKRTR